MLLQASVQKIGAETFCNNLVTNFNYNCCGRLSAHVLSGNRIVN